MRTKILKIYGITLTIGIAYLIWILITNITIPCLYFTTTGLFCPGCGTTRMLLSLIKLDFFEAFSYNPVVFILLSVWNLIALLCFWGRVTFVQNPKFLYTALSISIIIFFIWGIARNIY